jgi:hypothetical protein
MTAMTDAAKSSSVSKVLESERTARTSEPIVLLRRSCRNQIVAGMRPIKPDTIQNNSCLNPRQRVRRVERRSTLFD